MKIILFALLTVFVLGCKPVSEPVATTETVVTPEERLRLIVDDACDGLDVAERITCENREVMRAAVIDRDTEICDLVTSDDLRRACTDNILISRAAQEGIELCDQLDEANSVQRCTDTYYFTQGVMKEDIALCNKITNEDMRADCISPPVVVPDDAP